MSRLSAVPSDEGFTLLETAITLSVLAACLVMVGSLLHVSLIVINDSRDETVTTLLAVEKLETLRISPVAAAPSAMPAGSLDANMPGYFDVVDVTGRPPGTSTILFSPLYLRRWMTTTMSQADGQGTVFSVRVMRVRMMDGTQPVFQTEARLVATSFMR